MKQLLLIGGPMGVGKTQVCQCLQKRLQPSVYLDGDWCWNLNPFRVTEETKALVLDNIGTLLGRFLRCSEVEYVIFGWVMHRQEIVDEICARLPLDGVEVHAFSLLAAPAVLEERLRRDIRAGKRQEDVIGRSLAYLPLYRDMDTIPVWTDGKGVEEVAAEIEMDLKRIRDRK
ncbi:AAA family ATPase [Pseudoflavonifractor gallinarum]|nr:AAA family ATPase [Pseudoflavonifractor gallinarum]MBS5136223.1 AAA family ATPase [Oscillospiraceae bacterium]